MRKGVKAYKNKFFILIIYYMNTDPRTYINNIRNNGNLDPAVLNRLETYIRGWTAMENEDSAYRRAKVVFERFRDNDTDEDKIDELNDLLDGMSGHLQFMIGEAQHGDGTPEQIAEMEDVINTIDMLTPDMARYWVQNQNHRPVAQGRKRRRNTKKSKKSKKNKKSKKSTRYRR